MAGVPSLPYELRRGVLASSDPAGALASWSSRDHIAITIPDLTRSLPLSEALASLSERIPNRSIIVGLGLHRPMSPRELAPISQWNPQQHDPDDCVATMRVNDIPGGVHRSIAEADWTISIGVCELHQYAGMSGGHKGVSVGCGSRETIHGLHQRDFVIQPGVEVGHLKKNPFRDTVDLLGRAAGCHMALNWVPGPNIWLAGPPEHVVKEALRRSEPWESVSERSDGARIRVPKSKSKTFYQASRAATYLALSPNPPLHPGAVIALEASCEEGLGEERGFVEALENHSPPWNSLLEGEAPRGAGAQRALMLALLAKKYALRVYGCKRASNLRKYGIWASADPAPDKPNWIDISNPFTRLPQLA